MTKLGITRDPERMRRQGDLDDERIPQGQWAELATVAVKLGVPSVIAMGLVWYLTTTNTAKLEALSAKVDAAAADSRVINDRQLRVLQQICVNTSGTPEARGTCLSWTFDSNK